jgi:uncharacterized protein YndB with AHSA1/START domain
MSGLITVSVTREIAAAPERIFDAWLDPVQARRFLFATPDGEMRKVEIDPRVGGGFTIVEKRPWGEAGHYGEYVEIDRPRRLVFLFRADPSVDGWTRVTIEIEPKGAGSTLTLTHEMDPEWAAYEEQTRQGWTMIVETLARVVEIDDA